MQLSESNEFKYLFTMSVKCEKMSKMARMECSNLNNQIQNLQSIIERQKNEFAVIQASEKKDLEEQLSQEKAKQKDMNQQMEELLAQQKINDGEKLREQIMNLEKKIELGNVTENELKAKHDTLLENLEKEKQLFEEKMAEEKKKWETALESTKREKETLEATLRLQMEEWKEKEAAEWRNRMDNVVQEEKTVREQLSNEKLQLMAKMKNMEAAIKDQAAKAQQMQAKLQTKGTYFHCRAKLMQMVPFLSLFLASTTDCQEEIPEMLDTIDLTGPMPVHSRQAAVTKPMEKRVLNRVNDIMEEQLTCSICSELFVTAMTTNCYHTFCRFCILTWNEKNKECPNCRTYIKTLTRSLVIDNFIEKMVNNFPSEHKKRRVQLLQERTGIHFLNMYVASNEQVFNTVFISAQRPPIKMTMMVPKKR